MSSDNEMKRFIVQAILLLLNILDGLKSLRLLVWVTPLSKTVDTGYKEAAEI